MVTLRSCLLFLGCTGLAFGTYVGALDDQQLDRAGPKEQTAPAAISAESPNIMSWPVQPGIAANCNEYRLVEDGETCAEIAKANNIFEGDFIAWNQGVGEECKTLWPHHRACIGIGLKRRNTRFGGSKKVDVDAKSGDPKKRNVIRRRFNEPKRKDPKGQDGIVF